MTFVTIISCQSSKAACPLLIQKTSRARRATTSVVVATSTRAKSAKEYKIMTKRHPGRSPSFARAVARAVDEGFEPVSRTRHQPRRRRVSSGGV
eukprot:30856-Pelagococcus_subviridis.AAC.4